MNNNAVIETTIIGKKICHSKDGRSHEIHEIAYDGFQFLPGQFVMIQVKADAFDWSYPYMILDKTNSGFTVIAVKRSSLYGKNQGTDLILWGANGRGLQIPASCTMVTEAATCFLTAPIATADPSCHLFYYGTPESAIPEICPSQTAYHRSLREIAGILEQGTEPVYMALNLPTLKELMEDASSSLKARTTVFAAVDMACGVNACKGCYLHSPSIAVGIPVCCHGPYLPYTEIDFAADEKCFHYFE